MESSKEVYVVDAPFSGQEEEIDASIIDNERNSEKQVKNIIKLKSSISEDSTSTILNKDKSSVDDEESVSEKKAITGEVQTDVSHDMEILMREIQVPVKEKEGKEKNSKKRGRPRKNNIIEKKSIPIELTDGVEIDDKTCSYCLKSFSNLGGKSKHMRFVHNVASKTKGFIKCTECNIEFLLVKKLREHLTQVHNLKMSEKRIKFPNIDAFRIWKRNLEVKEAEFFIQQYGPKKTKSSVRWGYICHRSGKYRPMTKGPERMRMIKHTASFKMGIYCTAAISCEERPNEVIVKYCPYHYGHTKENSIEQVASKNQSTLEESKLSGVPPDNLLEDMHENVTSEKIAWMAAKKRDIKILKAAFESNEYNPGLTDSESVDRWVGLCLQMEDSPVLCYRQEELTDEFMLVIMTESQKQLLLASEKKVVCVDCVHQRNGGRFYLTCISIMDECDMAFPVAFCISNKIESSVIKQFLMAVKESTGPLSCTYFMSENESFYFGAWKEVMNDSSKWLWSMWFMDYDIHIQLRSFKDQLIKKADAYKTMRMLIECPSKTIFESVFQNFVDSLLADTISKKFGNCLSKKYAPYTELWAYCYRADIKPTVNFQLEILHKTLRYCCREGRKNRLDKFIFVLMKYVRIKMLDRLVNNLDEEKIRMSKKNINECHNAGLNISTERISSLSNKIWLIRSEGDEDNVYVVRDFDSCPERCMLRCFDCDICVHMYSCSCIHCMIDANLCQHIHAVVWKFLIPHFSPMPSPSNEDHCLSDSNDAFQVQDKSNELLESVLQRTHNIYKKVRNNKWALNRESLDNIIKKLDELSEVIDVYAGKKALPKVEETVIQPKVKIEDSQMADSESSSNTQENIPQKVFISNSVLQPSIPNYNSQPFMFRTLPQPNFQGNQTIILPNHPPLVLPPNKSEPYILIVPHNPTNTAVQKCLYPSNGNPRAKVSI